MVYLTFTLMYGSIVAPSFITCKLHRKQSGKTEELVSEGAYNRTNKKRFETS